MLDPLKSDTLIKSLVMHELPTAIQSQLKAASCLNHMELSEILERVGSFVTGSETNVSIGTQSNLRGFNNDRYKHKCFAYGKKCY